MDSALKFDIYKDIQMRTSGEIFLGVVGPVRTGKSTFIKRFMDLWVIPAIENENVRKRTIDELPQSGSGSTITTTEPKFIPGVAPVICPVDGVNVKVRLIDCVGFMVKGALGVYENDKERLVKTPWSDSPIPFSRAAEIGTGKVISEHSTIGIVVTTDGSFTEISRESYVEPEERTIRELKTIGKPFVVILNSSKPYAKETKALAEEMSQKYNVAVTPVNCDQLKKEDVKQILESVLMEFPIRCIGFFGPQWLEMLSCDHWLKKEITDAAAKILDSATYMKDTRNNNIFDMVMKIKNEYELINTIKELASKKQEFDSVKEALTDVGISGFGVVTPSVKDIVLDEPAVIKNGNKYGVRIKAQVPSINMLKTNINVEIAPIVGNKNQADDLIEYIKDNTKDNPQGIWETNIFGKTVEQIVSDGIKEKTHNITPESMEKISGTLEKVMNENTGLVCLIV